jgi:histidyl-tRNA synthetase
MPNKDELAEISHAELSERIQLAFDQWMDATKQGKNADEAKAIHRAYDDEQLRRLRRVKKYLSSYHS